MKYIVENERIENCRDSIAT